MLNIVIYFMLFSSLQKYNSDLDSDIFAVKLSEYSFHYIVELYLADEIKIYH